jgi:RNA polymerase sigma-70 factor, ECF subfamily
VPGAEDLPGRVRGVLAVIYLIFNEGYASTSGDRLVRDDLCIESIRLGRLVVELLPDEPEAMGLLALMLLVDSRRAARVTRDGDLVLLADQDRSRWDQDMIAEGQRIVRRCLRANRPGPYQIQAAINAVHSDAPSADATDWPQILQLYDQLVAIAPGPVVALNRAVALAEVAGPHAALTIVDDLQMRQYYLFHAVRADLLRRLGRVSEAALAYESAITLASNATEREFLQRRRSGLQ